jgi:class 3 adenylate cyclase
MSRTTATVLFTDLVGSTELRGRLGEEAADELRRKHDQLLAQAVESSNGRVVKGLGDGIMAIFTGASDATAAAVAIQQAVDRLNRSGKSPVPLAVRVGLSAGDVALEDDDVHGTPVIEAARLCTDAGGGEILAAEVIRVLAGSTAKQSFTSVGPLELKGLDHPLAAVRVEWEPAVVSSIPMPQLLTDVGRIFVGRDAELERLGQLWKEAAAGERHVVFLAGEPGVGKTRLGAELAAHVHENGGVVLAGRCDEDLGVPYQPLVEALRHFVDNSDPAELEEGLGRYAGELSRLIPELAEGVPDLPRPLQSDPETERYRLFDAVAAWLSAASAEDPLLLVLDDLQWAAKPTLLLLRHVVRAPDARRLLILGTYRDSELTHDHPLVELVADLRRQGAAERFPLSGLDDLAVAAIVEQAAGHALDEEGIALARAIYQETEGNPFFVREVLRHLAETNAIERDGCYWRTRVPIEQLGIPEGIRDVVGRRLSRLSELANQALRVAAVLGAEFEIELVQTAGELAESQLLAALDEAIQARLVSEISATRFRFSHGLVRATLYESLTGARKVALHRHVAHAIESLHEEALDDYLPALAHHWAKASVPAADSARAVEYATRAGNRALAQLAYDEAAAYYHQALELLDASESRDGVRRLELLISLGDAQRRAGDPVHRETLLDAAGLARKRRDGIALARAALLNNRGFWSATGTVDVERVAALDAALGLGDPIDSPWRARVLANLAVELHYSDERDRRLVLSDEALAMARRLGDRATLAEVILARCSAIWEPSTAQERLNNATEFIEVAEGLADPVVLAWAHIWHVIAAVGLTNVAEAERSLTKVQNLADELGQPTLCWVAGYLTTGRLMIAGRLTEAEALAVRTRRLGMSAGQPDAGLFFGSQRFYIRFDQGRMGELIDRLEEVLQHHESVSRRILLALAYCEIGQNNDARRVFEPVASQLERLSIDATWLELMAVSAAVCAHLQIRSSAADLVKWLAPYANQLVGAGTYWWRPVSWPLGLLSATLGRFDEAEARFAAAAATEERIGAPAWLARTRLDWARMLTIRRQPADATRARQLLGQALATARELGLANVERQAVALLQECR